MPERQELLRELKKTRVHLGAIEPKLLALAYAFEQATLRRVVPPF